MAVKGLNTNFFSITNILLIGPHWFSGRSLAKSKILFRETSRKWLPLMSGLGGRLQEVVAYGKFH